MDFRDTPDEAAFRQDLRAWLADNLPEGWGTAAYDEPQGPERVAFLKEWSRRLFRNRASAFRISLRLPALSCGGRRCGRPPSTDRVS